MKGAIKPEKLFLHAAWVPGREYEGSFFVWAEAFGSEPVRDKGSRELWAGQLVV